METGQFIWWHRSDRWLIPLVVILVVALVAVTAVFAVVFTTLRVTGDSMQPYLHDGDRLLMTRSYTDPKPGDIVAFPVFDDQGVLQDVLVKRVVAVAGQRVRVEGDSVYVDGELSKVAPTAFVDPDSTWQIETTVPADHVYVLGDNRPIALDSRQLGPVPINSIQGKAISIIFPLTRLRAID